MSYESILSMINQVAFPIICCIFMAKMLVEQSKLLSKFQQTLQGIEFRLTNIDDRLDKLESRGG